MDSILDLPTGGTSPMRLLRCSNVVVLHPTNHEYWSPQGGGHPRIWTPSHQPETSAKPVLFVSDSNWVVLFKYVNWMIFFQTIIKKCNIFLNIIYWICCDFAFKKVTSVISCMGTKSFHTVTPQFMEIVSHTKSPFVRQTSRGNCGANSTLTYKPSEMAVHIRKTHLDLSHIYIYINMYIGYLIFLHLPMFSLGFYISPQLVYTFFHWILPWKKKDGIFTQSAPSSYPSDKKFPPQDLICKAYGLQAFRHSLLTLVCRVPKGGGNWGTLRIPREDWGTLGKIREQWVSGMGGNHPQARCDDVCWKLVI